MGTEVLALFASKGADVQYILTGVRSSVALTPEEQLLIDRYRENPRQIRDAALRVLLGVEQGTKVLHFHGDIGQQFDTQVVAHSMTVGTMKLGDKKK